MITIVDAIDAGEDIHVGTTVGGGPLLPGDAVSQSSQPSYYFNAMKNDVNIRQNYFDTWSPTYNPHSMQNFLNTDSPEFNSLLVSGSNLDMMRQHEFDIVSGHNPQSQQMKKTKISGIVYVPSDLGISLAFI